MTRTGYGYFNKTNETRGREKARRQNGRDEKARRRMVWRRNVRPFVLQVTPTVLKTFPHAQLSRRLKKNKRTTRSFRTRNAFFFLSFSTPTKKRGFTVQIPSHFQTVYGQTIFVDKRYCYIYLTKTNTLAFRSVRTCPQKRRITVSRDLRSTV